MLKENQCQFQTDGRESKCIWKDRKVARVGMGKQIKLKKNSKPTWNKI